MSWNSHTDNLIDLSKDDSGNAHVDGVCIISIDTGEKLTSDSHPNVFKISNDEAANIAKCFKSKDFGRFVACGVRAEGYKYTYVRLREENDRLVLGKSKGQGAVTLQTSKTAIIVAHTKEGGDRSVTNKAVAEIVERLESENK